MTHNDRASTPSGPQHNAHTNTGLVAEIVTELTAHTETAGEDVAPLYQSVDPEALEVLFAPRADGGDRSAGRVTFTHAGQFVTVDSDGMVDISAIDDSDE